MYFRNVSSAIIPIVKSYTYLMKHMFSDETILDVYFQ